MDRKIFARFDAENGSKDLGRLCVGLLSDQMETWPDLREGCGLLGRVRERELSWAGFSVRLQHNPGRIKSTLAGIPGADRPGPGCFLCVENLPGLQKGILYRGEYLILCNPAPVFPSHLTISHLTHRPQSIDEETGAFLQLMADLGPGWTLLYNGPRCGASAPNHLHFQACPSGRTPIEQETLEEGASPGEMSGVSVHRLKGLGREVVLLEGEEPLALEGPLLAFLNALKAAVLTDQEPMVNLLAFHNGGKWRLTIFPRRRHRPEAFFREGEDRVLVSPGAVDMAGVLVTPVQRDFERLDGETVASIFREVSMKEEDVEKAVRIMARPEEWIR